MLNVAQNPFKDSVRGSGAENRVGKADVPYSDRYFVFVWDAKLTCWVHMGSCEHLEDALNLIPVELHNELTGNVFLVKGTQLKVEKILIAS